MTSPHQPSVVRAFGAGVLAALTGVAVGHLAAALGNPSSSPVLAVGATVIDATPTSLKERAVASLGTADKPVLVGSVLLVTMLLAGAAGVAARSRFRVGATALLTLVAAAGAAALTRPGAGPSDAVPGLLTAVAGLAALRLQLPGPRSAGSPSAAGRPDRRTFLVIAAAAGLVGAAGEWVGRLRTRPADVTLPAPSLPAPELPVGLDSRFPGVTPLQTPTSDFYRVDTRLSLPTISLSSWRLTIDGMVDRPFSLTFDDLLALPLEEHDVTLTCVSNQVGGPYVGGARWLGIPLGTLLARAGVQSGADQILSTDVDGFTISTPTEVALDGRATLVAVGMNGQPLPAEHGFPARLVTPGLYGFVGATKWLRRLTLTRYDARQAYWTKRGWSTDAPIRVSSRIDVPKPLASLRAGDQVIGGVAWAQHRGISQVEVSVDGGPWRAAELGPDTGVDYWVQWYLPWQATPGRHTLAARAVAGDGEVQTSVRRTPFPSGSSGIQRIVVTVD